ncbi:MAG: polyprenyl glycosylphosphotransferase [Bradyrhizobium sp.]|nr:MAG: polyprenyl glycosylphosphotransferase [Bradyrhizobium sp.]
MAFLAEGDLSVSGVTKDVFSTAEPKREIFTKSGAAFGPRPPLYSRIRFQLPGALLLAVGVPQLTTQGATWPGLASPSVNTAIGMIAAIGGGYYALRKISNLPNMREVGSVIPVFTASFLVLMAAFFLVGLEYSRTAVVASYLITIVWFTGVLIAARRARKRQFVLVPVGDTRSVLGLPGATWRVVDSPETLPTPCDAVVADLHAQIPARWQLFLTSCALAGIPVYHHKDVREAITGRLEIEHLSENMLLSHNPLDGYSTLKRAIDFVTAAIAAVLLGPFLIAVAILVRLDSKGPALFRQERLTRGGKTFAIYKFRTMAVDSARPGSRQDAITVDGDPRITRLGALLRASRIDELPQIINILRGEMSWIGPRPEAVPLANWYQEQLPFYQYRHIVLPGISGWAQVNQGHVTDLEQVLGKLHYDFFYIKNLSIWLDILIVLKTVRIMLTGMGAR